MEFLSDYIWPYIGAQVVSILILWASITRPRLGRLLFFLLFGGAAFVNLFTTLNNPDAYLFYATTALPFYANFINGAFKEHRDIILPAIVAGQALIAFGMILNKWWVKLACAGAVIFLLAIAPLGYGAGFPFSITVSIAAYFILKNDRFRYLWKAPVYNP